MGLIVEFLPLESQNQVESAVESGFAMQQLAHDFYRELASREAFDAYCQWYAETAAANQQELTAMDNDIDVFGLFWRR